MRNYYLPCPYGFPSQLIKPGCVDAGELDEIILREFPFEADLREHSRAILEIREWLKVHWGEHVQNMVTCPQEFYTIATSVDTGARWCFHREYRYRFKNADDAMLFKLTWAGR